MDCLFKEQEDGLGGMIQGDEGDPFEEGFEDDPEWAEADIEDLPSVPAATTQSKRNLLFEVRTRRCT